MRIDLPVPLLVPAPPSPGPIPLFSHFPQETTPPPPPERDPKPLPLGRDTNRNSHPFAKSSKNDPLISFYPTKARLLQGKEKRMPAPFPPFVLKRPCNGEKHGRYEITTNEFAFFRRTGKNFEKCLPAGTGTKIYFSSAKARFARSRKKIGCTPRGSCNNTFLRRVLRRFSNNKCFLEGFLEGACKGFQLEKVLRGVLRRERFIEGA